MILEFGGHEEEEERGGGGGRGFCYFQKGGLKYSCCL